MNIISVLFKCLFIISLFANISYAFNYNDKNLKKALEYALNDKWDKAEKILKNTQYKTRNKAIIDLVKCQHRAIDLKDAVNYFHDYKRSILPKSYFASDIKAILSSSEDPKYLLSWFNIFPPTNHYQKLLYIDTKIRLKKTNIKNNLKNLRFHWRNSLMKKSEEQYFYKKYKKHLRVYEIRVKIANSLWDGKVKMAKYYLQKLSNNNKNRPLYEARIMISESPAFFRRMKKGEYREYMNDDYIKYSYIKYRLKTSHNTSAYDIFMQHQIKGHYSMWWRLKHIAVRNLIRQKQYRKASKLVSRDMNLKGVDYVDQQWLAGWIEYRFLNNPKNALPYFLSLYNKSKYGNSKSKGGYWIGRVYDDIGDKDNANIWYKISANYYGYFYGQLSLRKLKSSKSDYPIKFVDIVPFSDSSSDYKKKVKISPYIRSSMRLANLLYKTGHSNTANRFVLKILMKNMNLYQYRYVMNFFYKNKSYPLAVIIAKQIASNGYGLNKEGYPILNIDKIHNKKGIIDRGLLPLYFSLIRQESNFDQKAISPVGATGIMQLMPATARKISRKLKIKGDKYISDPYTNMTLGSYYVNQLNDMFDNYILTIASYNAGEHRGARWVKEFGDPNKLKNIEDIVDWIERITFGETRFYVKKVLENITIYDYILNPIDKRKDFTEYILVPISQHIGNYHTK